MARIRTIGADCSLRKYITIRDLLFRDSTIQLNFDPFYDPNHFYNFFLSRTTNQMLMHCMIPFDIILCIRAKESANI